MRSRVSAFKMLITFAKLSSKKLARIHPFTNSAWECLFHTLSHELTQCGDQFLLFAKIISEKW